MFGHVDTLESQGPSNSRSRELEFFFEISYQGPHLGAPFVNNSYIDIHRYSFNFIYSYICILYIILCYTSLSQGCSKNLRFFEVFELLFPCWCLGGCEKISRFSTLHVAWFQEDMGRIVPRNPCVFCWCVALTLHSEKFLYALWLSGCLCLLSGWHVVLLGLILWPDFDSHDQ